MNHTEMKINSKTNSILEPWSVQIHTNEPMSLYRIVVTTKDDNQQTFQSTATFKSDEYGWVDSATHAPVAGDYQGVDATGLIWSMKSKDKKEGMCVNHASETVTFELEVFDHTNKLIANQSIRRNLRSEEIIKETLSAEIIASVYYPRDAHALPAIVIAGGSDGAVHESAAALLASQGYVVLALAYFGKEGLPKGIENIPLEYVDKAFQHLENQPFVDSTRLGIIGHSRGSELALLYASHYPKVKAVVATAPSAVLFSGMVNFQMIDKPAWSFQGNPFPYFQGERKIGDTFSMFYHLFARKPFSGLKLIERNLENKDKIEAHALPVHDIQAPILFFAGSDDQTQPASFFTKYMEEKLATHDFYKQHRFIYHEGSGHFSAFPSSLPNLPQSVGITQFNMTMMFGGTRQINAKSAQQSWEETLDFLSSTFS